MAIMQQAEHGLTAIDQTKLPGKHKISRVPDQNSVSQACYIVKIHHSGGESSIWCLQFALYP